MRAMKIGTKAKILKSQRKKSPAKIVDKMIKKSKKMLAIYKKSYCLVLI